MCASARGASAAGADTARPASMPRAIRRTDQRLIDPEATTTYDAVGEGSMLDAVGMDEINKIFAVIDAMGVHREQVVIPLGTGKGRMRRMPSGKLEIIVDAEMRSEEHTSELQSRPHLVC